jgi:tRNA-dihydrouridine synthase
VVSIPVIVNGDLQSANDCKRALDHTGCAGVMIGRRAIEHPWIFREARARLDHTRRVPTPTVQERFALCREHLLAVCELHGPRRALRAMRRCYPRYLQRVPDAAALVAELCAIDSLPALLDALERGLTEALGHPGLKPGAATQVFAH